MTEETETQQTPAAGEFEGFARGALRSPRKGIQETLLAQLLLKANFTNEGSLKISVICEACYLALPMMKDKDKLDLDLVAAISKVCRSFMQTITAPGKNQHIEIAWTFPETEENWQKFIAPWNQIRLTFYPLQTTYRRKKYPERIRWRGEPNTEEQNALEEEQENLRKKISSELSALPEHERFFFRSSAISEQSFLALKGEFEDWALSSLGPCRSAIAELVSPDAFDAVKELFRNQEPEEKKNENSMDSP